METIDLEATAAELSAKIESVNALILDLAKNGARVEVTIEWPTIPNLLSTRPYVKAHTYKLLS